MLSSRAILNKLLLLSLLHTICLTNLSTKANPSRCPHDIFSDVKGWREGERCVAIWEEKLTSTYAVLNELCSQRAPEATLPNVPPQPDVFQSHGVLLNPEYSVFLGASLTARYCASDRCSVVIEYSNKSGDLILYDEKNLTVYHSTRPRLRLPKNIQNIHLNYSGTDYFCLTMSNETTNAVPCLKSAITLDALICETDQLRNCLLTNKKRSYKSNCTCEKYYKGPHCGVVNEQDFFEEPEEQPWFNNPVVTNSVILSLTVFVIVYAVYRVNQQRNKVKAYWKEEQKPSEDSLFASSLFKSTTKQTSPLASKKCRNSDRKI